LQHGVTPDYIRLKVSPTTEHDELAVDPFRLGDWLVEPRLNRLTRGNESFQIELKMMDVLVCLAEAGGELVTRQRIIDTVWATEFITEKTLTRAVAELRRTLGDDAKNPRFIETIHRRGYRLIAPVEAVERTTAAVTPFPARPPRAEDDHNPYPGLAAFTEDEAEFFFGREAEVGQLWRKITARRLLAVIGPSGVGKSSLLRAGLIPASPEGWGTLILHPGESVFKALGRALVPVFREDTRATGELLDIDTPDQAVALVSRWRGLHERALIIVDQFEELFTLNPPEIQASFAELLGRLARDADVHVLLSLRDDFLYRCHAHPPLRPILEDLTALEPPNRGSLRRALEQPAARLGYGFEGDDLVDEMLDAATDERSALPLLAFAVARLWETRDRTRHLLTRQAFEDIGGVGGALARHAESTLQAVGSGRIPLVREIFRNLVTGEGRG
jgi:DNA-binding winged helix-turn-helix (wHTH) protein